MKQLLDDNPLGKIKNRQYIDERKGLVLNVNLVLFEFFVNEELNGLTGLKPEERKARLKEMAAERLSKIDDASADYFVVEDVHRDIFPSQLGLAEAFVFLFKKT